MAGDSESDDATTVAATIDDATPAGLIRLVIADDQPLFASGLRMQLDVQADMVCLGIAIDGEHAVRLARRHRPDVVLMDIRMPVMNGLDATRAILADSASESDGGDGTVPAIVVLTTIRHDEAVFQSLQAGATAFLTKDATPTEMLATIRAAHAGRSVPRADETLDLVREFEQPASGTVHTAAIEALTPREREVYLLLARGLSNTEIADTAYLSETTVKSHVRAVLQKLHLRSRVQVVIHAYENGLIGDAA